MAVCDDTIEFCRKGERAAVYCRRDPCIRPRALACMTTVVPRPEVQVTTRDNPAGGTDLDVVISREGKGRSYTVNTTGGGTGPIKEVIEKIIADPHTAEWLPAGKRY